MKTSRIFYHYAPDGGIVPGSLFPDLSAAKLPQENAGTSDGFAATTLLDTKSPGPSEAERAAQNFARDVLISSPPAASIREYLSSLYPDTEPAAKLISVVDPVRVWASLLVNMLAETGSKPVEQLHFRAREGLRTMASIEQTLVVRHSADRLRVAHAYLRSSGFGSSDIQAALVERSHMLAVIVGSTKSPEIDLLLNSLKTASARSTWRCPSLLFILPPNNACAQIKLGALRWPSDIQVSLVEEPMTSPSAVWNAILAQWRLAQAQQARIGDLLSGVHTSFKLSLQPSEPSVTRKLVVTPELASVKLTVQKNEKREATLLHFSTMDGVLACAVVSSETAQILVLESFQGKDHNLDIAQAASACAKLMHAHRQSARDMGLTSIEEVTTTSGGRQIMLRPASRRPGVFMMALLDKQRTNMTLARLKLLELDRHLS